MFGFCLKDIKVEFCFLLLGNHDCVHKWLFQLFLHQLEDQEGSQLTTSVAAWCLDAASLGKT